MLYSASWENKQTSFRRPRQRCSPRPKLLISYIPSPERQVPSRCSLRSRGEDAKLGDAGPIPRYPRHLRAGIQQRQHAAPGRRWVLDGSPASVIVLDAALPSRAVGWSDKTKTQAACEISLLPFSDSLKISPCLRCGHRDISSARTCLRLC